MMRNSLAQLVSHCSGKLVEQVVRMSSAPGVPCTEDLARILLRNRARCCTERTPSLRGQIVLGGGLNCERKRFAESDFKSTKLCFCTENGTCRLKLFLSASCNRGAAQVKWLEVQPTFECPHRAGSKRDGRWRSQGLLRQRGELVRKRLAAAGPRRRRDTSIQLFDSPPPRWRP